MKTVKINIHNVLNMLHLYARKLQSTTFDINDEALIDTYAINHGSNFVDDCIIIDVREELANGYIDVTLKNNVKDHMLLVFDILNTTNVRSAELINVLSRYINTTTPDLLSLKTTLMKLVRGMSNDRVLVNETQVDPIVNFDKLKNVLLDYSWDALDISKLTLNLEICIYLLQYCFRIKRFECSIDAEVLQQYEQYCTGVTVQTMLLSNQKTFSNNYCNPNTITPKDVQEYIYFLTHIIE